ncbi:hypothetical protein AGMMS49992_08220 [Clostridia bacterium]|nr:hypothetical protein AGMMS49992_08220 [Clostridia bacterium]
MHMGRKIEISDGNILKLQEAIENAESDDVIYITKDLSLNLDQYQTAMPTATKNGTLGDVPFSIIGKPSASKGSDAKIHIGSTGNPLKVSLVGNDPFPEKYASVTIKNISLHMDLSPTVAAYGGYVCTGLRCAFVNCDAEGSITEDSYGGSQVSPFIAHCFDLDMVQCTNNCNVTLPNGAMIGGFAGHPHYIANIVDCVNNGSIIGGYQIGGIAGRLVSENLFMANCINNGDMEVGYSSCGGIAGLMSFNENCIIKNCCNTGKITTHAPDGDEEWLDWADTGGIVGEFYANETNGGLYDCVNYGNITGTRFCKLIGGIVGHLEGGEVFDCVNYGSIRNGGNIGGIVGGATSFWTGHSIVPTIIKRCVDKGSVYGTWCGVGGIAGSVYCDTTVDDCRVCTMVDTIEGETEEVGGIVGMVQYTADVGAYVNEGLAIIRNNMAFAKSVKVNHIATANDGLDYVHRILGRFLPDQLNPDMDLPAWASDFGDKFLQLDNNYALQSVALAGNNSNILEGYDYDHFYNIQSGGVYPEPGAVVKHSDPDYGANRLNGADVAEFDPAHPLPNSLLECMYGYIPPIITATLCGFNHGDGVRPGCFTVGLYADDGITLLAKATNDSKGIMKLPLISPSLAHPGSNCFWVRRVRNSNNHVLNYVESFPVRVWVTQDDKGKLNHYVCYSMMLGEPNFLI